MGACVTEVMWIVDGVVKPREIPDIAQLLAGGNGFLWVDIPVCDEEAVRLLSDVFALHPLAVEACRSRSHVPKLHAYPGSLFVILHTPELGDPGHVHLLELDLGIGPNFLITVHGPLGEGVELESALTETRSVRQKIESGRLRPSNTAELAHALGSAIARRQDGFVSSLATRIAALEHRIVAEDRNTEEMLDEMFRTRHELLTIRTMSAQSAEVYGRITTLAKFLPEESHEYVHDLHDQFARVASICEGEKEFLHGVLDYYQSRVTTKINVAMERLALIAAVAMPITAVAGVLGMNTIANDRTDVPITAMLLLLMILISGVMLLYARRKNWW